MKYNRVAPINRINATDIHVAEEINFRLSEDGILEADDDVIQGIYDERFKDGDDAFDFVRLIEEEIDDDEL